MFTLNVKPNVKEFTRYLDGVQRRQVPFALANALTWTAQDGQSAVMEQIQKVFETRVKWWAKNQPTGIKITPAKKDRLTAAVHTNAYFAKLQEDGGIKSPFKAGKLQVPTDRVPKSRRKAGGVKIILSQKTTFSTKRGVFRKVGGKKSRRVELLFWKTKTALIKPRFGFRSTVYNTALKVFPDKFSRSLANALKTAR